MSSSRRTSTTPRRSRRRPSRSRSAFPRRPVPAARSSSLPAGKENIGSVRQYRSMLDVEGPPKLGPVKTFTYDELYVDNAKLASCQAPPFCKIGLRHLRLSTLAGSLSLFWRAHAVPEANYGDGSCERRSHRPPSEGVSGPLKPMASKHNPAKLGRLRNHRLTPNPQPQLPMTAGTSSEGS